MNVMKDRFIDLYNHQIHRPGADKLLQWLETTDFFTAPASTRFHLAREDGLVEHSVHVYERLQALYQKECLVQGCQVDRCVLYVYRLAVYYAEHGECPPDKQNWWDWKDS